MEGIKDARERNKTKNIDNKRRNGVTSFLVV